jgi:site-specific recombinase XerD
VGEIRYRYLGSYQGQKYISPSKFKTREEAEEAERIHRLQLSGEHQLLSDFVALRLETLTLTRSQDYVKENRRILKQTIATLGDIPVAHISKPMIHKLLLDHSADLKQRGKTQHKANSMLRCLKAFFNYVIDIQEVDMKNPVKGLPKFSIDHKLKYIPPQSQINDVALHLNQAQWELYRFVEETGCRVMEAVRLRGDDCQPRGRNPHVVLWTRKAKNSDLTPRRIPFPKCLRGAKRASQGRVYPEWNTYPTFLYETVTALQIEPRWNWHNLRHRRATIWANEGMTILEIMTRLGHANLSTTQIYLQLLGFTY